MAQSDKDARAHAYWRANLKLMGGLLVIWFVASFGFGILFVDALNEVQIGGYRLGFWFAQQGSIYTFVLLIFAYAILMRRIERRFGVDDTDEPDSYDVMNGDESPQ
ncbi:MAG: DUF4212 domain-containing protein [Alphaproteobacteria bacterium]